MKAVDAQGAFELMYALLMEFPWLNEPGVMRPEDAQAEAEAVSFLLAGDMSREWGDCSHSARRVVNTLLVDFTGKLRIPGHPIRESSWVVSPDAASWQQALAIIAAEIEKSHPYLVSRH